MLKKLGLLIFGSVLVLGLSACDEAKVEKVEKPKEEEKVAGDATEKENDDAEAADDVSEDESNENLVIGDTVDYDGLEITLNEVRIEAGGEFDEPAEDQFIVANLTVKNNTDEAQTISSIMNVELKDEEGYSYNTTFLMEGTKGQLDGEIEPGGTLRGEIPFDAAESATYELHFSDPFKTGKAIWTISSEELQ